MTEETSLVAKKLTKTEIPMFYDEMKKKPLTDKEKEEAKAIYDEMSPAEREKHEEKLWKKQWQNVVRGVVRIYRFTQKYSFTLSLTPILGSN